MSGRFVVHAGQHVFKSGEKLDFKIPILPFYAGNPLCPLKSRFGENTAPENQRLESKVNQQQTLSVDSNYLQYNDQKSPAEPYPNSKGEDVNTPPVNKLPTVQLPDFSKRQGHTCSKIPAFKDWQRRFDSLSGSYCRTKADGSYDAVEYDSQQHENKPNFKIIELDRGKKQAVPFYNYANGFQNIDIEFDSKKNVLVCSRKIILVPKTVIRKVDQKEIPFVAQKSTHKDFFTITDRDVTKEIKNFIQEKQEKVNKLINYAGYYLSPSDCNVTTGCSCIVPVILKVSMQVQHASERQDPHAVVIHLFPSATRADAKNWGEVALKDETYIPSPQPRFERGSLVVPPSGPAIKVERLYDTTSVYLHEIAHLFSFPDEYFEDGGAVHKMYIKSDTQTVDIHLPEPANDWKRKVDGHLMSTATPGQMPIIPPYYYERFREYFENKTGIRWEIKKLNT